MTVYNSDSFKYKSNLLSVLDSINTPAAVGNLAYRTYKYAQVLVPLKYVSSFSKNIELPLINTKIHLELSWTKNCIMSTAGNDNDNNANTNTFQITKTELYVPVLTLSSDDNTMLNDLLRKGFKRSVFWNEYKNKLETHAEDAKNLKRIVRLFISTSKEIFFLAYDGVTAGKTIHMNSPKGCAFPRVKMAKFNVLIDGRNFYDKPVSFDVKDMKNY